MKIDLNCLGAKNHLNANIAVKATPMDTNQKNWSGYENTNLKVKLISYLD